MKHLNTFEANINDIKDKYLYLICWNDGYSVQDEGWITTHYEEIIDDSSRLDVIQKILNLDVDESYHDEGEQILNGYIEWISKIRFDSDKINSDLMMQLTANKYNV